MSKRAMDLALATVLLIVLAPVMLLLALAIRLTLGAPVLFIQTRAGLQGRAFRIFKFRTMSDARDGAGNLLPDAMRLTRFGQWLRASSCDELPELLNVLKGDMSLVGPRPLLVEYLQLYSPEQARRHEVLPGLTGWAQVNGRNAVAWSQKLAMDVWYVDHQSFKLDMKILCLTVLRVFSGAGIAKPGHVTTDRFTGASK